MPDGPAEPRREHARREGAVTSEQDSWGRAGAPIPSHTTGHRVGVPTAGVWCYPRCRFRRAFCDAVRLAVAERASVKGQRPADPPGQVPGTLCSVARRKGSIVAIARHWWPIPLVLGASLVIQKFFFESRYDVSGHAAGHLSSATAPFLAAAVVIILVWATPSSRQQPDVLVGSAAWLGATVLVLVGNVRVVDALVDAGLGQAQTDDVPDVADHGSASVSMWLAVIAALALTAALWRRRHVSTRVAIGAAALNVVFPPWFFPGAGVVVLVVAHCVARERVRRVEATPRPNVAQRNPPGRSGTRSPAVIS